MKLITILVSLLIGANANAYFSTIDNGELVAPGAYQASFEPQLLLNDRQGFNVIGRLDVGLDQQSSLRALVGVGKVDFQIGGFYKIVPFPDTPKQPAIGADAGVIIARYDGDTKISFRLHPLVSKRFESEVGDFTPYASLPIGVTTSTLDGTYTPVQLVGGTEFRSMNYPNVSYFAELGINLNKSFSYVSAALAYRFDDSMMARGQRK